MAYGSSRRPAPYNYETPEQKARDQLRAQKTIAGVTQRADQQAQSVAALTALAKATGVPMSQLPAGGIHNGMSPADVQAATDRINGWVARQPGGVPPRPTGAQGPTGQPTMSQVATQNLQGVGPAQPAAQTRTTPTGGTETLVQSESGPRWVASVGNAPAPNNLNGQITRDPGGRTVQVQSNPIALRPTAPGQPVATVAQNQAFYANPTSPAGSLPPPTAKPWQPALGDYAYSTPAPANPMVSASVTKSTVSRPVPTIPGLADVLAKPSNSIPGLPANADRADVLANANADSAPTTPPAPSPIPNMPPITGLNPAASKQPFNPDDDDSEEAKRRLAIATGKAPPVPAPYQF